jgi:hypothetical protein
MRRNSTSSMGALHPIVFFTLVYGISLFMAIFVCRTVYYSINNEPAKTSKTNTQDGLTNSATAMNTAAIK